MTSPKGVQMNIHATQKERHGAREQTRTPREEGAVGGGGVEAGIGACALLLIKQVTRRSTVWHRELYSAPRGGRNGKEIQNGVHIHVWLIHFAEQQKPTRPCQAAILR